MGMDAVAASLVSNTNIIAPCDERINYYCRMVGLSGGRMERAVPTKADRCRADARGTRSRWDGARRPTFAKLFIAFKPLTYFAAAPPRKVTDSACSLPSRRHCLFNRAAALIKVVETLRLFLLKCNSNLTLIRLLTFR